LLHGSLKNTVSLSESKVLNSRKLKIVAVVITGFMLVIFAVVNVYLTNFVESEFDKTLPINERVAITDAAIARFKTTKTIDAKVVIEIIESGKKYEVSTEDQIRSALDLFGNVSNILIWLLLLHFIALMALVPMGKKN
jgi:hypothetical protein